MARDLRDTPLSQVLDTIADDSRLPGGGAVAALVVSMAAALVAMAARRSRDVWPGAAGAVAQADVLRRRAAPLAGAGAKAYSDAAAMLDERRRRGDDLGRALARAAELPLLVAQVAADVAALARDVADSGDPAVRGDAVAAALLAEAAARAAAHLVEINLATMPGDLRVLSAQSLAVSASTSAAAALGSGA